MQRQQRLWTIGVAWGTAIATLILLPPARADDPRADITGTNIWNNTAPIFKTDDPLTPELVQRIQQFNRDAETAFRACNDAIATAEASFSGPRRFARQPVTQPVPLACQQLNQLRQEGTALRSEVQRLESRRVNPANLTW